MWFQNTIRMQKHTANELRRPQSDYKLRSSCLCQESRLNSMKMHKRYVLFQICRCYSEGQGYVSARK